MIYVKTIHPKVDEHQVYYNWCKADSTNAPIRCAVGKRGIGKTFTPVKKSVIGFLEKGHNFIYVVENKEQIKTLCQDSGSKFWNALKEYAEEHPKTHKGVLYNAIIKGNCSLDEEEDNDLIGKQTDIKGGAIRINGEVVGFIIAWDDFANIKRNNFSKKVKYILIDEFMPEIIDINSLKISRKIVSLIQSICRTRTDVIIYMMSNALRRTDVILEKFRASDIKLGEAKIISDDYGVLAYIEYINPADYKELNKKQDVSVASRLAVLFDEDNLDKNVFRDDLKENELIGSNPKATTLICCLHDEVGSVRIAMTKDHKDVYVLDDYGNNTRKRICLDKAFISPNVKYLPDYKDYLVSLYSKGMCKFESTKIKYIFLEALKIKA